MAYETVATPDLEEFSAPSVQSSPDARLAMQDLHGVPMTVTVELGRSHIRVRDVLGLKVGSLVVLDKFAGQMADILVNSVTMARGEIVVMGDFLHVRLSEVTGGLGNLGDHRA